MRFGIIKYDNGEIVKVINLDKKLQKEKRIYEILEETENQKELDNLYAKYTGGIIKEKPQREAPFGSVEYNKQYNIKYLGKTKPIKHVMLIRYNEDWKQYVKDKENYIFTDDYEQYKKWYYESNNNI